MKNTNIGSTESAAMLEQENQEIDNIKRPPQSVMAEQYILGGLLVDNTALDAISDVVRPSDFIRRDHQMIFETIQKIIQKGEPADYLTVYESFKSRSLDAEIGGLPYLTELAANTPSAANIRRYAEIVRDKATLRQLISVGEKLVSDAFHPQGREPRELVNEAEREVLAISDRNAMSKRGFRPVGDILQEVSAKLLERTRNKGTSRITGLETGFPNLDNVTNGLQKGDLIIIAGRPSMGKTSFAINIAEHVGYKSGLPVAVFSFEMGSDQLVSRMISSIGLINSQNMRKGDLTDSDWDKLLKTAQDFVEKPIYIDDTPNLTISEVASRCRRLIHQTGPLGLIVIDYIQLMPGSSSSSSDNRSQQLSEISRGLKLLAKELDVPIICLSQLNRGVDSRTDRRPQMSDLRESGAIEQDADIIMFIYRDVVYTKEACPNPNEAEVIIAKQRSGPIGTLRMIFKGEYTKFLPSTDNGFWDGGPSSDE